MSQEKSPETRGLTQLPEQKNWFWVLKNISNTKSRVALNLSESKKWLGLILDWIRSWADMWALIKEYFDNPELLVTLNNYIWTNLTTVLKKSSIYTFDEISTFITLLWMWKYHKIIIDLNSCNIPDLNSLITEYVFKLESSNNKNDFDVYFQSFLMLINSINTLCILDQVNTYRKKLIPQIVSSMRKWLESIILNQDKYEFICQENINSLNHYIWLLWINFSHSDYYYREQECIEDLTKEYYNIAKRQIKGFHSSKESNYWNNPWKETLINAVFLWNFAFWLSLLIHKSKNFWEEDLLNNPNFKEILKIIWGYFWDEKKFFGLSLEELKNLCNNIFSGFFYEEEPKDFIVNQKSINTVIDDFCNADIKNEDCVIESIHNLVLFNNFDYDTLNKLWNHLLSLPPYNNYSFEFYKLKILDLIIEKSSQLNEKKSNFEFCKEILNYVDENKTASQLLYAYSSLYLSISYSFSLEKWNFEQNLAVSTFVKFLKFNKNIKWIKLKYPLDEIYYNIWLWRINSILSEKVSLSYNVSKDHLVDIWKAVVDNWIKTYENELSVSIERKLNNILNEALDFNESVDDNYLLKKLSNLISIEVFDWLANITIADNVDFNPSEYEKRFTNKDKNSSWNSKNIVKLSDKHFLVFDYPSIYNDIFNEIYKAKIEEVVKNVNQIMSAYYSKMKLIYEDRLTNLSNESRLRVILNNIKKPVSFINLKILNLDEINGTYWKESWDSFLVNISTYLNLLSVNAPGEVYIFKLSWSKFWILVLNDDVFDEIVKQIELYKSNVNWKIFSLVWAFWVVRNETSEILEKSNLALLNAREIHSKYYEFTPDTKKDRERSEIFKYLSALDNAIENDNVLTYFQPIKDLKTWDIYKYEALMRVRNGENIDSPYMYLQAASKYSRLSKIAKINIKNVFEMANIHNEREFSLNLSWEDFLNNDLFDFIMESLSVYWNVSPSNITFEILESEWSNYDQIRDSIIWYKQLWFKIWIDDYWAEYSNIHRLNTLLDDNIPDFVKIDWSLIKSLNSKDIKQEQSAKADIENIIKKAQIYGFKVVAEYIEDERLEEKVKFMWIDFAQWYNIWKPNNSLDILK